MSEDANRKRKILVVEDDAMVRSFVTVLLDSEGYEIVEAEDGREMFQALAEHDFDLIVLDIMLPDGNGVDFARKYRARNTTIPIVFATGVTDDDTKRQAAGLMQIYYVTKPYDADTLLARINAMFEGSPVMETPEDAKGGMVISDAPPWYSAPLVWGPALALVVIILGAIFLIPPDEDPALPLKVAGVQSNGSPAADGPGATEEAREAAQEQGIVLQDAPDTGGGTATGPAGSGAVEIPPEQKVTQACGQLPVSENWNNNSIKRVLRYVRFVHRGDWGAYVDSWQERLKNVQDLQAQGKPVMLQKKDIVLSGDELDTYVDLMVTRVKFLRCAQQIMQTVN